MFPAGVIGASSVTVEGWFNVTTLTDNAFLFNLYAYGAGNTPPADVLCALAGASYPAAFQGKLRFSSAARVAPMKP